MKTVVTTSAAEAAAFIRNGGVVAFPTETVYGLGANVFDPAAVAKIFEAKRRPSDNPLIAHVATRDQIRLLAEEITGSAKQFIDLFFPGPLSLVLKKRDAVPQIATAGLDTIGIRMPRFDLANEFLHACGDPVVAPSANISGRPSPTTWQAVFEDLDGRIDCILKGEPTEIGLESTVVDCTGKVPIMLRAGSISLEQLRSVVPETREISAEKSEVARSPGLLHRHYSPKAVVVLVSGSEHRAERLTPLVTKGRNAYIGLHDVDGTFELVNKCSTIDEYAHSLFEFFRTCDRKGIDTIYCETVPEAGVGTALMDRLKRAAER